MMEKYRLRQIVLAAAFAVAAGCAAAADSKASQYYEDALQRFEKKDYPGSIVQLKNAIKIDPRQLSVHLLLGRALLARGEVVASEVAFNEAVKLGVNRAEVVVPLARALVGQARLSEVVAAGGRFDPANLPNGVKQELLLVQAAAHSDLNAPRDAARLIAEAKVLAPNAAEPWLAEVPILIRARQFKEAAAAADKAMALQPQSAQAAYLRGSVAHAQGDIRGAMSSYDKALALDGQHLEALVSRAGVLMDMGRHDEVRRDAGAASKVSPADPRPKYLLSLVADRAGDRKGARTLLAEITALLDPMPIAFNRYRPQVLMLGGLAHYGLGNMEKARPYLEGVLRQQPEAPVAKLLSQIYLSDKNFDRAIETLETYLRGSPRDTQAVMLLASAQLSKGRMARAVQLLQDAAKTQDTPQLHTFLGLTLAGAGKPADALPELERAYRRDPSQTAAGAALVDLYLRAKQPAKAVELAETLVKRSPRSAEFLGVLGHARGASGDLQKARVAYEQALQLDPAFGPAELALARLDVREHRDDSAVRRLNALLARNERNVDALSEAGLLAERRGRLTEAVQLMSKAADHSGMDIGPVLALVDMHLRAGSVEAAKEAMKRAEAKAPDQIQVLMTGARVRLAAKDTAAAQANLNRASKAADFDPRTLTQIALLQIASGDLKGAQYSSSKALQADPAFVNAKALSVEVSIRLGDFPSAEQGARELVQKHPNLAIGPSLQGDLALARGLLPAAIDAYRRAHQLGPSSDSLLRLFRTLERSNGAAAVALADGWLKTHGNDVAVRHALGAAHARAGRLPAARAQYEALIANSPEDAEALNNLANVLLLQKDPGALAVAERAMARKPGAPHILGTVGWAAFQAGQPDRALQMLRDARLRDPTNLDTRFFLATVLASKGRMSEAREELKEVVKVGAVTSYATAANDLMQSLK